ncbi:hypothetical protein TNCV_2713211 [Trichonephila clavipes]|nr:hypothetical protein TNCV_2713211 [Trichonephila clavipes]
MQKHLQGRRLVSSDEVKVASQGTLWEFAKSGFQLCLKKCIVAQEDYFEDGCTSVLGTIQSKCIEEFQDAFKIFVEIALISMPMRKRKRCSFQSLKARLMERNAFCF